MVHAQKSGNVIKGKDKMKNSFNIFLDFFLPRFCTSCKNKLSVDFKFICGECISSIKYADEKLLTHEFNRKFKDDNIISGFTSLFIFEKDKSLQHIIHSLKYEKQFLSGIHLGRLTGDKLKFILTGWKIDLIIPVPLHKLKKMERGFNQSYYISKGIGKELKIKVSESVIKREKYTETQTTMNLNERQKNIGGAFKLINKKNIAGKNILLVDDVITTGSTINECGKVLIKGGAKKIYAASAAITGLYDL
jgi:competence protein ComFC